MIIEFNISDKDEKEFYAEMDNNVGLARRVDTILLEIPFISQEERELINEVLHENDLT